MNDAEPGGCPKRTPAHETLVDIIRENLEAINQAAADNDRLDRGLNPRERLEKDLFFSILEQAAIATCIQALNRSNIPESKIGWVITELRALHFDQLALPADHKLRKALHSLANELGKRMDEHSMRS